MEIYMTYKRFGIRYIQITGTTLVEYVGRVIEEFPGLGELKGREKAKAMIDRLAAHEPKPELN